MFLGVEIGGTKLQLALGDGGGTFAAAWRGRVEPANGAAGILAQLDLALPGLLADAGLSRADVRGVGVGFGGPVDSAAGRTVTSHQVAGWDDFPLGAHLQGRWKLPVHVVNDADAAGLGEAVLGAGRGLSPVFYVTLGSGVGGALILDGAIYEGAGRGAAEIGHLNVAPPADAAPGRRFTLEDLASGWGIARQARERGYPGEVTAVQVAAAAKAGDGIAQSVMATTLDALAEAFTHVVKLLCPRVIVVGGGVSLLGDQLFAPLRQRLKAREFAPFAGLTEVVPAALGELAVPHGAVLAARRAFGAGL